MKIEYLSPYLPFDLKVRIISDHGSPIKDLTMVMLSKELMNSRWELHKLKPILRPLSDLLEEEFNYLLIDEPLAEFITEIWTGLDPLSRLNTAFTYDFWQVLFENHFDVFGLIPKGLAIDINTLNK